MATSGWQWNAINRNRDYSYIGDTEYFRENWQLTRWRYSDAAYSSELGDTESTSLSATNGGTTESIVPPTFDTFKVVNSFGSNEVDATTDYTDYEFYKVPWTYAFNNPVYAAAKSCQQSTASSGGYNDEINGAWRPILLCNNSAGTTWFCVAEPSGVVQSGATSYATYAEYAGSSPNGHLIASSWTSTTGGSPVLAGVVASSSTTVPFTCTADTQTYDTPSVNWFKQTQTWVAQSPWG